MGGLVPTFVEATREKLVGSVFLSPLPSAHPEQDQDLEILFPSINEGMNFKLCCGCAVCPQIHQLFTVWNELITLPSQDLALLGFFPMWNIIFPVIDQCWFFLPLWYDKTLILKYFLTLNYKKSDPKSEYGSFNFWSKKQNHFYFCN